MHTRPAPLDGFADDDAIEEFRVAEPRDVQALLKQLLDGSVLLSMVAADGRVFTSAIWTLDGERGTLGFNADPADPAMQAVVERGEATVVGYLDNVKLQFDVHGAVLVRGRSASVLSCPAPREIYRFQRRQAFRVRPLQRPLPVVVFEHPDMPGHDVELRVIDVSIGGCALFLPHDQPSMNAGVAIARAAFELDADTRFVAAVRLQHVTAMDPEARGVRLGFEFSRLPADGARALQRYIDLTQKRGRLMKLN